MNISSVSVLSNRCFHKNVVKNSCEYVLSFKVFLWRFNLIVEFHEKFRKSLKNDYENIQLAKLLAKAEKLWKSLIPLNLLSEKDATIRSTSTFTLFTCKSFSTKLVLEAAARKCSAKYVFLKILQYSQEGNFHES